VPPLPTRSIDRRIELLGLHDGAELYPANEMYPVWWQARGRAAELERAAGITQRLAIAAGHINRRQVMPRWQGWKSSLAAVVVLVLFGVAFVAGTAGVALLSKYMPAIGQ
jgi:hypothetical protein